MKTTTLMIAFVVLFGYTAQPRISFAQCGDAPKLTIQTDSVTVSGETVHISRSLPQHSDRWFYSVSCRSSRLFNFSLWAIIKFNDRDGYYLAKSWNLQILDSHDHPEKEVIFDRENEFYFWGNVVETPEGERIIVTSIVGLPEGIHGDVILREVHQEDAPGGTAHH
jgi:hypothetical protein